MIPVTDGAVGSVPDVNVVLVLLCGFFFLLSWSRPCLPIVGTAHTNLNTLLLLRPAALVELIRLTFWTLIRRSRKLAVDGGRVKTKLLVLFALAALLAFCSVTSPPGVAA